MSKIQKIAAATYATIKHLQGYQLLKNPKGATPYEVNMIKYKRILSPNLDEIFFYNRIQRTFEGFYPMSHNKYLISTHIFDTKNLKMTNKKNMIIYGGGVCGYLRDKEDVSEMDLNRRNSIVKLLKLKLIEKLNNAEESRNYYASNSFRDMFLDILTLGRASQKRQEQCEGLPRRTGFFKLLKENLSQGQ